MTKQEKIERYVQVGGKWRKMDTLPDLMQAIEILKANYERALKMEYVTKPLSWALYYTWREIDKEEKHK